MLKDRVITAVLLFPVGLAFILLGSWPFTLFVALVLGVAAWEYARIFRRGIGTGYHPSLVVITGGVVTLALARGFLDRGAQMIYGPALLALLVMISMAVHVFGYQRGHANSAVDFAIDLGGIAYLGWLGSYLISLRLLEQPSGQWALLLALPAVWLADSAAYFFGRRYGKHKIAPRVSPGKSWEGYAAGILFGAPLAGLLALLYGQFDPAFTFARGALLGLLLAAITPLGDLGESLIKRQFGVKDSSNLLRGHGGVMDRIDSWVWAAAISYYVMLLFW
ncbi:MAG TPA: phosphatidate cytidylyltransferase [Anaerolineaceae bacterium]